jgi:3-deoxy-D-manno-octulosonic-acid transferase
MKTTAQPAAPEPSFMLPVLYRIAGRTAHALLPAFLPAVNALAPNWEAGQRLGNYQRSATAQAAGPLLWIHAASVGEIQAARALIAVLAEKIPGCRFVLTAMTKQGRDAARAWLPETVRCELAPIDTPQAVTAALKNLRPDLYVCLETELWPTMLLETGRAGIPMLLLNGRLSESAFRRYQRICGFMTDLLQGFAAVGVIRKEDGDRYCQLGVEAGRIKVCGNLKYDLPAADAAAVREKYQRLLHPGGKKIFICGSTRNGEEELLLPVYGRLRRETGDNLLWIIAPRHLNRLEEVRRLLTQAGLEHELLSACAAKGRSKDIVLVDSLGELADLYAVGDVSFCGGSLVAKGGHNIMEPVRWHRPVLFGPFMHDYQDAADLVLTAGAGVQVRDADELADRLSALLRDERLQQAVCQASERLARSQQGAAQRQADLVLRELKQQVIKRQSA